MEYENLLLHLTIKTDIQARIEHERGVRYPTPEWHGAFEKLQQEGVAEHKDEIEAFAKKRTAAKAEAEAQAARAKAEAQAAVSCRMM